MKKITGFVLILIVSSQSFSQTFSLNVSINKIIPESNNRSVLFKIRVKNHSKLEATIPDSTASLVNSANPPVHQVGYQLQEVKSKKNVPCEYLTDEAFPHARKLNPGEEGIIRTQFNGVCYDPKKKCKIIFFLNIITKDKITGVEKYKIVRSKPFSFSL